MKQKEKRVRRVLANCCLCQYSFFIGKVTKDDHRDYWKKAPERFKYFCRSCLDKK